MNEDKIHLLIQSSTQMGYASINLASIRTYIEQLLFDQNDYKPTEPLEALVSELKSVEFELQLLIDSISSIIKKCEEIKVMKEFQITQVFAKDSEAYLYFEISAECSDDEIIAKAIALQKEDRKKREFSRLYLFGPPMERPTILIKEYDEGVVINGKSLKAKWR